MLSQISWSAFIWFIFLVLLSYYLFIILFYYRAEVFAFSRGQRGSRQIVIKPEASTPNTQVQSTQNTQMSSEIPFTLVHELLEDMKKIFVHAANTKMIKEELIQAIRGKMKSYPNISETDLKEDITEHIVLEVKQICGIDLTTEDVSQVWPNP